MIWVQGILCNGTSSVFAYDPYVSDVCPTCNPAAYFTFVTHMYGLMVCILYKSYKYYSSSLCAISRNFAGGWDQQLQIRTATERLVLSQSRISLIFG
jgi:hypothetical protein